MHPKTILVLILLAGVALGFPARAAETPTPTLPGPAVLQSGAFRPLIESFNAADEELYKQEFPNVRAWEFLEKNIPLLDCPDPELQKTYYFRWWTYRKQIKRTPGGYVMTEFLPPVSWAGKLNTINCAAGHHIYEGRWLRDPQFLDDYSTFWFRREGEPRRYSFWAADAILGRAKVTGNTALALELLPDLIENYRQWEATHRDASGLYWQIDDRDGMEVSLGGSGLRATINSYMYGDAQAIAQLAELAGKADVAAAYRAKAAEIKKLVQERLWDDEAQFFKVLPRGAGKSLAAARELHGLTPWYFNLPDARYAVAWKQLLDPQGFFAPFGPTTAERRAPGFKLAYSGHECQWNGPSWPFSTAITLTAMANLLNNTSQSVVSKADYLKMLTIYSNSQRRKRDDGTVVPWIDENLNPLTGDWISRTILLRDPNNRYRERGKDYNHSTFCDLVISGLVGLRPSLDRTVEVSPLLPDGAWDWFCLDGVAYHGHSLTILWDRSGTHYGKGQGFRLLSDGRVIATAPALGRLSGPLE